MDKAIEKENQPRFFCFFFHQWKKEERESEVVDFGQYALKQNHSKPPRHFVPPLQKSGGEFPMKEICLGKRINISIKPPRHFVPPLQKNGGEFPMNEYFEGVFVMTGNVVFLYNLKHFPRQRPYQAL